MDKSTARLKKATRQLQAEGVQFTRFAAVDGSKVDRSRVRNATGWCKRFCTNSMLGCALSHIRIWQHVRDAGLPCALVLEDDVKLAPGFASKLRAVLQEVPSDYDILFLGCFGFCSPDTSAFVRPILQALTGREAKGITDTIFVPAWPAGTHCYVVSNQGASKLAGAKAGYHIDMQISVTPDLRLYAVNPPLATQADMNSSTMTDYSFPTTINWFLSQFTDSHGISLAYFTNVPFAQLPLGFANVALNSWLLLFVALGLGHVPPKWVGAFFGVELLLGGPSKDMAACGVAYLVGFSARRLLSASKKRLRH